MFDLAFFKIVYKVLDWSAPTEMGVMNEHQTALRNRTHASTVIALAGQAMALYSQSDRLLYQYVQLKYVPYFGLPSCEKICNTMKRYTCFPG